MSHIERVCDYCSCLRYMEVRQIVSDKNDVEAVCTVCATLHATRLTEEEAMKRNGINYRCSNCCDERFFTFMWHVTVTQEGDRRGIFAECTGRNVKGEKCPKVIKVFVSEVEYQVLLTARRR